MNSHQQVIEINLQSFLIPLSLILGALLISLATFFALRTAGVSASNNNLAVTPTPTSQVSSVTTTASIDDDPYLGSKNAKVAMIDFGDYECPYCKAYFNDAYQQILKDYVNSGQLLYVFRDYTAVQSHNPASEQEALAATCVQSLADNTKYFAYHDLLFTDSNSNGQGLASDNRGKLIDLASGIGIDKDKFTNCLDSKQYEVEYQKDNADALAAGGNGTPSFVIGTLNSDGTVTGSLVEGYGPLEIYQSVIDKYLAL